MSTPTTGRRIASKQRRQRPSFGGPVIAGAALVALSLLLLVIGGLVSTQPEPEQEASTVPVSEVVSACAGARGPGASQAVTMAAPLPEDTGEIDGEGNLSVGPVGGQPQEGPGERRGVLETVEVPGAEQPGTGTALSVAATGSAAVGRSTFQVDQPSGVSALAVQECPAPRARWWFTGAGAGLDHRSSLVLTNVDPGPAVVDVLVHDGDGPVDSVGTRGITVPPGEVRTVDLLDVAPQSDELAVHVEASRGRVVAAVADSFATRAAATPGQEWIPAQADPSRVVRLAPLPRRADRRTVVVANPSGREVLVDVEISSESGSFVPTEAGQIRVPPGAVVTAELGDAVGNETVAVLLRSDVPVTATVRSSTADDVSYAAAAPVLDGPAAALLPDEAQPTLQLTAGEKAGTATVTTYTADGTESETADLDVQPGTTLAWTPERKAAYLVVTPQKGGLFGGVSLAGDAGAAQVALHPLPTVLRRPAVVPVVR